RTEIAGAYQRGCAEHARVIAISVRLQTGQAPIKRQSVLEQSRMEVGAGALRAEGPALDLEPVFRRAGERRRLEVHRAGKGRRAGAARADAALDLDRFQAAREVGKIGEVEHLIFGIVERNTVNR